MRTRTNLSNLSIAAIAIVIAATTSFAQTNDRGAETASSITASGSELTASNARQPASFENAIHASLAAKSVSETQPVAKPLTLSAAAFTAGSRFAKVDANRFVGQQLSTDMKMSAGVPSTTANELSETKTKGVEFVACRTPKFPYREN